jgi:ribosomal protein S18 acetylase RimI-like enzyme
LLFICPACDTPRQVPVVANVAVATKARRRGIAEKLCRKCEVAAKGWGYREVALAVDQSNSAAIGLYQKKLRYAVLWDEIKATKIVAGGTKVRAIPTTTKALVKQLK